MVVKYYRILTILCTSTMREIEVLYVFRLVHDVLQ